jgi:hypothetical protein
MKSNKGFAFAIIVLALTLVASASAPKGKKQTVSFFTDTVVAGTTLKPGDYQLVVDNGVATFFRNGKEVAKVSVQSQDAGAKFDSNELTTGEGNALKGIGLAGSTTRLVVTGSAVSAGGGGSNK